MALKKIYDIGAKVGSTERKPKKARDRETERERYRYRERKRERDRLSFVWKCFGQ